MSDTLERLRERWSTYGGAVIVYPDELLALLDVAEAAQCLRFTMIPCRERPELPPGDYCAVCKGLAALDSAQ